MYSHDHSITSEVLSLVCPSLRFENSNSCLWNLCSFGLVYSIDWVRQRLDISRNSYNLCLSCY